MQYVLRNSYTIFYTKFILKLKKKKLFYVIAIQYNHLITVETTIW